MKKPILIIATLFVIVSLIFGGCTSTPTSTPTSTTTAVTQATPTTSTSSPTSSTTLTPTTTPTPSDTTPPPAITGLIANNAYDGKINLWWDKSTTADFDHYNIYVNKTEMANVTGIKAIQQIKDIATCRYQITGLEDGNSYYFTVTAVDRSGNEDVQVASVSATPTPMPRGTKDSDIAVDIYQSDKAWAGTTILTIDYEVNNHHIKEVNMLGEVIWQQIVPQKSVVVEAELLSNNNILYSASNGVFEIDRSGEIVWSYLTDKIDHDADRLPNGNTIFVFGMSDQKNDAQVVEVNQEGQVVWKWYAKDYFDKPPFDSIYEEGSWVHTNAVTRLANGNTLISLRNFDFVVEVDPQGAVVRTIGEGVFYHQHDPELLPNGNLLICDHAVPNSVIEYDPATSKVVWKYKFPKEIEDQDRQKIRDANRLPNGNTLVVGSTIMAEVTPQGEIVWRLNFKGVAAPSSSPVTHPFYKADRISTYN